MFNQLKFTTLALLALMSTLAFGQIETPVTWTFDSKPLEDNKYELIFKASIEDHWHLYSQFLDNDDGPVATTFNFDKGGYELVGKTTEGKAITEYDPNFEMDLNYFEHKATFKQVVQLTGDAETVKGYLNFMVCDASKCLPPEDVDFSFSLGKASTEAAATEETTGENHEAPIELNENAGAVASEIVAPAKFDVSVKALGDDKFEINFHANIEDHWHIYAQNLPSEDGPLPTAFVYDKNDNIVLEGETKGNGNLIEIFDPVFEMDLAYYEHEVTFTQVVKANGNDTLTGEYSFMACNESQCIAPEFTPIKIAFTDGKASIIGNEVAANAPPAADGMEYAISTIDLKNPVAQCGIEETHAPEEESSLLNIFMLGFFGGLIALLTPCVFPMIPLTVSFFTKGGTDKKKGLMNALMYGGFIFLVYIILSLPFHFLDQLDPNILNNISTNIYLNIFFFVIFIVFAISFFGYFEITMPASFTNKMDAKSDVGGLLGIFFMALTLALVSFSCTGPILGSLLAGSLTGDGGAIQLTAGMGGFGFALALPFTLFAAFPGWLNSLPKSGGWLNSVKVVLGFAELALAFKFLSNADLVEHWGLLKIEVFLGIWIVVGIGLALYFFGKIKFPHDSPLTKLSFPRISLGVLTVSFVIYLGSGFIYNENTKTFRSLSLLSGLAPPAGYSWIHPNHCPLNLNCFHDYEEGLAYAKQTGKPVMLDFTGWACVNCRKMEEQVWSKPEVFKIIADEYVLISLYVDDREKLPEDEQVTVTRKSDGKQVKLRTVGDKWALLQTETFVNNSQPYYVLMSNEEVLLNKPQGYTPEVTEYVDFLNCGLGANETLK